MLHQSVQRYVGVINISTATINHFSKVVGRHICGHSHGNTIATIYQQIRNLCGHYTRFNQRVIEVVGHVDSVFL